MLSYEEVRAFALKHYDKGGDGTYECLSKWDYDNMVMLGHKFTEESLLEEFARYDALYKEMEATVW